MMNDMQSSRLLWAIKLALAGVIVYAAVHAVAGSLRLGERLKPNKASGHEPAVGIDQAAQETQPPHDYSLIAKSGLFADSERTAAPQVLPAPPQPVPPRPADEELELRLVGTIASGPAFSLAIIEDGKAKTTKPYKIGETIGSAVVESIQRDKAVVRYRNGVKVLVLNTDTAMPAPNAADANGIQPRSQTKGPHGTGGTALPGSDRLGQVETLLRGATIEPYVENGQTQGLRVTGLDSIPAAATFGLKNGDIIQSVNGQTLTNKQKAFQVLQKARTQSKVNMQLLRDGKVTDLSFNAH